jgi:hypothetical protein
MAGIPTYLSVLTLYVNGLNYPSEDNFWQTQLKRKTQQYVVYRKPIPLTEINTGLGGKIYQSNGPQKQVEVAILISDKVDIKLTLVK